MITIAVDGPGGSGKSSLAKELSRRLSILYLDTGALYRAVAFAALERFGAEFTDDQVRSLLPKITVTVEHLNGSQHVFVNGEDVSDRIRTQAVSMAASRASALPEVRAFLLDLQRDTAKRTSVIMDGRDVGTVILPDATLKIFLTAEDEVRARRRYDELLSKGIDADFDTVLRELKERDENDRNRSVSPLRKADDAVLLDNSKLTFEQTVAAALALIGGKLGL